ncbi:electron transfer flavoprotein-ubiquinone oxidoreductase [bacterium]|nr:electron transfer flavoprotein-ubiquinone oxidoreductase [bacterium]
MAPAREVMPVDVLFVGAGPASLAGAYHLTRLIEKHNAAADAGEGERLGELEIAILEKGKAMGAHAISGAVMDPRALRELMPDFLEQGFPAESEVTGEDVLHLSEKGSFRLPITPPPLANHGNYVVSLSKVVRWLAEKVEEKGAFIIPELGGRELLMEGDRVAGVRTSDKGLDKHGKEKGNFQPGADLQARVTVFGEGPRGSLTKELVGRFGLDAGRDPQVYATGVKETWKLKPGTFPKGKVVHTMGYPLDSKTYGGSFAYGFAEDILTLGFVTGLDYWHPATSPQDELQRLKEHPLVAKWLHGAEIISYGAKTIPVGGWFACPRPAFDGGLLIGDSAGYLNAMRLKGIHLAMKSGMLAAETIFDGLVKDDLSAPQLARYERAVSDSWIKDEMWKVRNFHQAMSKGLYSGMFRAGIQIALGGADLFGSHLKGEAGHERMRKLSELTPAERNLPRAHVDNERIFDKLTNVFQSGTIHEEDQPCHLQVTDPDICRTRCVEEYGNPCQHFCPAAVYEMHDAADGKKDLHINASNCVHCKTCDVMDPYQIINWVVPEGGGGPAYKDL